MNLLGGLAHVALLTSDAPRLHHFYAEMFGAQVTHEEEQQPGVRLSFLALGPEAELNIFQIDGNHEAERQTPMFGRGRIDHFGVQASSLAAFRTIRERLVRCGASDGFVTDFGPVLSLFFRDPDGMEGEVCVANPYAQPGVHHPPGTPAPGFDS